MQGFLGVNLELHKPVGRRSSAVGARIEAPKAEGVCMRSGVSPFLLGKGLGRELCPLPRKIFAFGSEHGEFWCILVHSVFSG